VEATPLERQLDREELSELLAAIGFRRDYSALDLSGIEPNLQGWGGDRPIFERVLSEFRRSVLIEVGTWKGASVLHMRSVARRLDLETAFICVDTWLGSAEHWSKPEPRPHLRLEGGFPTLYREFIVNVLAEGAVDDVYPLPLSSAAAARTLAKLGVTADVLYLDAAHEEEEVLLDLNLYWPLVRPGGAMFGHDYNWPGVKKAVDRVLREAGVRARGDVLARAPVGLPAASRKTLTLGLTSSRAGGVLPRRPKAAERNKVRLWIRASLPPSAPWSSDAASHRRPSASA